MRRDPDDGAEALLFATRFRPNRSLSGRGRGMVLALFAALQGMIGVGLLIRGAWPATVFLALTWIGLRFAFARNAGSSQTCEELELSALELRYARINPAGRRCDWRFHPLWVRLEIQRHQQYGVERLDLLSRRRRLEIGASLGRAAKTRLADRLSAALALARRGPRFANASRSASNNDKEKGPPVKSGPSLREEAPALADACDAKSLEQDKRVPPCGD